MSGSKKYEIKVDKSIKPLHHEKRKPFDLMIGEKYYVSFSINIVLPCRLLWISEEMNSGFPRKITIEIPNGDSNTIYADEIGRTPEEAVLNQIILNI